MKLILTMPYLKFTAHTAPNNEAIAELFRTQPEGNLVVTIGELQDILLYHVVAGSYPSTSLTSGDIEALNGDSISVTVTDGKINVNDACVIVPDIQLRNGIIHVIDMVLIPPGDIEEDTDLNVDVDDEGNGESLAPSGSQPIPQTVIEDMPLSTQPLSMSLSMPLSTSESAPDMAQPQGSLSPSPTDGAQLVSGSQPIPPTVIEGSLSMSLSMPELALSTNMPFPAESEQVVPAQPSSQSTEGPQLESGSQPIPQTVAEDSLSMPVSTQPDTGSQPIPQTVIEDSLAMSLSLTESAPGTDGSWSGSGSGSGSGSESGSGSGSGGGSGKSGKGSGSKSGKGSGSKSGKGSGSKSGKGSGSKSGKGTNTRGYDVSEAQSELNALTLASNSEVVRRIIVPIVAAAAGSAVLLL